MNRDFAAEYLRRFNLDPADLGELVSEGTQHYTCRFRHNRVIKIPKDSLYMRTYRPLKKPALLRDIELLNTRFAAYTLATEICFAERGYVMIQDFLPAAQNITPDNFDHVAADFACILELNRQLVRDCALSIDFFGSVGFRQTILGTLLRDKRRARMTNLLAVPAEAGWTIKIVDVNLSELRYRWRGDINLFHWLVDFGVYHVSGVVLHDHFGVRMN